MAAVLIWIAWDAIAAVVASAGMQGGSMLMGFGSIWSGSVFCLASLCVAVIVTGGNASIRGGCE